ncbi:unnamed protein product [Schistosoma margrebowiei]|uniref:Uncharacterized protein n=1 Tax=Schistosoma margrebowiei TaxID=48269 RepID=A0A183M8Y5_9TREM|nr:unnamed protein product [Schistosoma margrebowiei]
MRFTKMGTSLVNVCPVASSTLLIHVNFVILSALNVETFLDESNRNVLSNIISLRNAFVSCGKLVHSEAQVLNELDFNYDLNDFISTAVYPYRKITSNVYSNQCEKYVLNEATSFISWGHKDPTLFRGEDSGEKSMVRILDINHFNTKPTC